MQIATSTGMKNWIAGKTVNDLLNLASSALGGGSLPSGVSLSDITNAIDVINKSFDGGRFFLGYYSSAQTCSSISSAIPSGAITYRGTTSSGLNVKAFPNPYTSEVKFQFTSPVSGTAILEAYDLMGRKLGVIFEGKIQAGVQQMVTYNVPVGNRVTIMYKLSVGDQTFHGTLIPLK